MTYLRTPIVLVMAALALPGCFLFDDDYDYYYDDYEDPYVMPTEPYNDGTLIVEGGSQFGDMGEIEDYAADAVASNATYYGNNTSVRLDSVGDNWWVMSYLNIYNLDVLNAPEGTYTYASATYDGAAPQVSVTGCSGPSYGNYTFDTGSSDAEVTITDNGDGSRTLEFTARFEDYYGGGSMQVAEGTLIVRPGEGTTTETPPTTPPELPSTPQALVATDATQSGAMGDIASYDGAATATDAVYDGTSASLRLDSIGDGWWVMSFVSINNLDIGTATPGTYTYSAATYDGTSPQVAVTGMSGPSYGDYSFNAGAESAEITITDNGDGSRTLNLTAQFTAYDGTPQTASASFRYTLSTTLD